MSLYSCYNGFYQKDKVTGVAEDVEKGNSCSLLGILIGTDIMEKIQWFFKRFKIELPHYPEIPLLGISS